MRIFKKVARFDIAIPIGFAMTIVGIVAGIVYAIGGAIYDFTHNQLGFGTLLAMMAIIGMPIIFASSGFIFGLILEILNNTIVRLLNRP